MTDPVRVREIGEGESLRRFIDVSWRINAGDPMWVAPLRLTLRTLLDRRKHPFHRHAEAAYFLAERDGQPVGRIAAVVNHQHNEFHDERTGFFGLFESEDRAETAEALLGAASSWLHERGMERVRGPVNLSTNEEFASPGVLLEGFDRPPMVAMGHNPPYYAGLLEGAGLAKAKDLHAYWMDVPEPHERLVRLADRLQRREGIRVRALDLKHFERDVDIIKTVYNAAWVRNWGFVPMTDAEFAHVAKDFRPVVDPDLCLIAEVDGDAVGFSLALPNLNEAFRKIPSGRLFPFGLFRFLWEKRRIRGIRVLTLGFKPEYQHQGLGALLYLRGWQTGIVKGYTHGEASWILEDNLDMRRALESMGARVYKTYRIYEAAL